MATISVLLCAPAPDAELLALLADEGVEVVRAADPAQPGRREALQAAAASATGDVCIALGPHARPEPGFAAPLAAAVRAGASLAAPVIGTPAGDVFGYRAAEDRSLWPIAEPGTSADAAALDCLAAPRSFFVSGLPAFEVGDGPYELALGPVAIVAGARVRRVTEGPLASVVICTRDRAGELREGVEALVAHGVLAAGCEIVIVDSASSDATPEVAAELATRFGDGVRAVRCDAPGLSRARNAGAAAARHDVLCFIDDDSRPAPGWLEAIRGAFADPRVAVAGGPIHALWPDATGWRPPAGFEAYLSVKTEGDDDHTLDCGDFYGANFAVRRTAVDAIGGFDERWGPGSSGSPEEGELAPVAHVGDDTSAQIAIARDGVGEARYVAAAAVGHRIEPERLDERWMLVRVFRHGLIIPHVRARFRTPAAGDAQVWAQRAAEALHAAVPLAGALDVEGALAGLLADHRPLETRLHAARELGVVVRCCALLGAADCRLGPLQLRISPEAATGQVRLPERAPREHAFSVAGSEPVPSLRILAMVPAFNEGDVIRRAVLDLIDNGLDVLVLDNCSTDDTAEQVADLVGRGVVRIERFPDEAGYDARNRDAFVVKDQLRRFEEIAAELDYDWYLVCDADEFRESPWPDMTLGQAIGLADGLGFSAINFELFNFRPTDDAFVAGADVREHLTGHEPGEWFDRGQIKAWRNPGVRVDLSDIFGAGAQFPGRRVCPVPFILRHYPIRGETHGRRKVFRDRLERYAADERAGGWHHQYDRYADGEPEFLWDEAKLVQWDGEAVRARILSRATRGLLLAQATRGIELERTEPAGDAVAAWLGRTVAAATPDAAAISAAGAFVPAAVAGSTTTDPLVLGVARHLANEADLRGRPHDAGRLEETVARLAAARRPRFTAVAYAEELLETPDLLADYGRCFGERDAATLVILAHDVDTDRLVEAVASAGLDGDGSPDLLALTGADAAPEACDALFTRRDATAFAGVPRLADARALRAAAERRWLRAA